MNPSLSDIKTATCAYYAPRKITRADLEALGHHPNHIGRPRQVSMYLARALTTNSLPQIGRSFGGRHHTTVLHAIRAVEKRAKCLSDAEAIRKALEARTSPWGGFAIELAAARAIGEFIRSLPPLPVERNFILIATPGFE